MLIFLLIAVIILLLLLIKRLLYKFKHPRIDTINISSGCVGGGKTSSVICRIKAQLRRYYFLGRNKELKNDYIIISDFPIGKLAYDDKEKTKPYRYLKIWNKRIRCYNLDERLLIEKVRLPQQEVIVVLDEFSSIASQFDYDNPNIKKNVNDLIRFLRHYTHGNGYMYLIDQCSRDIFLQARRRASYCYNMISSRKIRFLPIMIYEYRKILLSDEVENVVNLDSDYESDIQKFIFFSNPFKWFDSYAYENRYKEIEEQCQLTVSLDLKRNDTPRIPFEPYYSSINKNDNYSYEQFIQDNIEYFERKKRLIKKYNDYIKAESKEKLYDDIVNNEIQN